MTRRYSLIHVFSKFGKIAKLDYLFHKTGPAKGKPRGYAFVEYATNEVRSLVSTTLDARGTDGASVRFSLCILGARKL